MARNGALNVRTGAVTDFNIVPVDKFSKGRTFGEMSVNHGQEFTGDVGADLVVVRGVEPHRLPFPLSPVFTFLFMEF